MKVSELFEDISDEDVDYLDHFGYTVVDSVQIGDYSLHLVKSLQFPDDDGDPEYQLALNKHKYSFTDPQSQNTRHDADVDRRKITDAVKGFRTVLGNWKRKYGTIYVGSYNEQYINFYHKLLTRFKINPTPIIDLDGLWMFKI